MYSRILSLITCVFLTMVLSSCAAILQTDISVSGKVEAAASKAKSGSSVFLVISKTIDYQQIMDAPLDTIVDMVQIDTSTGTFSVDLSESGLKSGSKVCFFAFSTENYQGGIPNLSEGDIVGYYIDSATYSYYYTLQNGENSGIVVTLDKTYKENNATVSGTIKGTESGDVIVIAYTGEITSMDADIDFSKIIGFLNTSKEAADTAYTMELLPFCPAFPIANVYIIAILDVNLNGVPDNGDRLGFYSNNENNIPSLVELKNEANSGYNIEFTMDYTEPSGSGAEISINGSITPPDGYTASTKPIFILITTAADADDLFENPISAIKYFVKLPQGTTTYNIDLTNTGLAAGDEIRIIALWDKDYTVGFPSLSAGDMIGYYQNSSEFLYSMVLAEGTNTALITGGWTFAVNKTYTANNAVVNGTITGAGSGKVIIIAYNGAIDSLDADIDMDKIIGYTEVTKGISDVPYSIDLFPFVGSFPVSGVYLIAVLDLNNNGKPDDGDRLGFYSNNENSIPSLVTLNNATNSGYNIEFTMDYAAPVTGGTPLSISGSFTAPTGYSTSSTKPVFIIIAKAENTFELFNDPMSVIKYFVKIPQGSTTYNIDLTNTGLVPGDEIRILALYDIDYTGGFPNPTANDKIVYYQQKSSLSYSKVLTAGSNTASLSNGWSFGINKTLNNYNTTFSFKFNQTTSYAYDMSASDIRGKDVLVVMIYKDGVDDSWDWWGGTPSYGITDMDYIISIDYLKIPDTSTWQNQTYTVSLFPFIYDSIPVTSTYSSKYIQNVYVYVILDANGNGWPDTGENLGYYWTWYYIGLIPTGQKAPMKYPRLYLNQTNTLSNEYISIFSNRQYE